MDAERVYTEASIDVALAEAVWNVLDWVEHSAEPIEMVALIAKKDKKSGKYEISFEKYVPGAEQKNENMIAAMGVTPSRDQDLDDIDEDLDKAMRFMYFYHAAHTSIAKLNDGVL